MIRYTAYFNGHVQGVGFRYSAAHIARRHPVAGYVQNLPDGRVRIVAEGEPQAIDQFFDHIRDALSRHIEDCNIERGNFTGEFGQPGQPDTFGIRY